MTVQLAGYLGDVLITTTPNVAITDQALTDSGDHTTFNVDVSDAAKRYWDDSATFVFQTSIDGSTWNTVTPASVRYVNGQVTFSGAVGGTHQARIHSGAYLPYASLIETTSWSFQAARDFKDVTSLKGPSSTDRSKSYLPLLLSGTMSLNKWWQTEVSEASNLFTLLTTGAKCVLSLVTPSNNRYEGYVFVKDASIKDAVNDVVSRTLNFQITSNFYAV